MVKVSKIFGDDTEASDLLTEMLGNKHIRNEILESLCHCTFQGKAQFRELIVVKVKSSRIFQQQGTSSQANAELGMTAFAWRC